jgi:hypothetical protein
MTEPAPNSADALAADRQLGLVEETSSQHHSGPPGSYTAVLPGSVPASSHGSFVKPTER